MVVFNEDTRVKIPATIQLLRIGYNYQSLCADDVDIDFKSKIFINRFKPELERINGRTFTYDEIKFILQETHNMIKNNDVYNQFANYVEDLGETKTVALDRILKKFLEEQERKSINGDGIIISIQDHQVQLVKDIATLTKQQLELLGRFVDAMKDKNKEGN